MQKYSCPQSTDNAIVSTDNAIVLTLVHFGERQGAQKRFLLAHLASWLVDFIKQTTSRAIALVAYSFRLLAIAF
jgi:TorA maturation chaperone TorD